MTGAPDAEPRTRLPGFGIATFATAESIARQDVTGHELVSLSQTGFDVFEGLATDAYIFRGIFVDE